MSAVVDAAFLDQLDALALLNHPRKRGRALERLVADLFRPHHVAVTMNAGIARPRQTDVSHPGRFGWRGLGATAPSAGR
jgi:hypothetical protein